MGRSGTAGQAAPAGPQALEVETAQVRDLARESRSSRIRGLHQAALRDRTARAGLAMRYTAPVSPLVLSRTWPAWRSRVRAARVVWGSQPVAAIRSARVAPC